MEKDEISNASRDGVATAQDLQTNIALRTVIFSETSEAKYVLEHFKDEDDPIMVADAADIVEKFVKWKREMPRVEPFYAVKCNPDPIVLNILAALGTGFDCASKGEIDAVLELGVHTSRIIYAHPYKPISHLRYAAEAGVRLMTFDSEMELHKIKEHHADAHLVIRIRADERGGLIFMGGKYGCEVADAGNLLRLAKELELRVVGVSFHIGVNHDNPSVFATTIEWCKKVFDIAEENGQHMTLLNLGGGFPGAKGYASNFLEMTDVVRGALEQYFPTECGVRIVAEPGKYFVESAFRLYTKIIGKRPNGDHKMYFINDGLYGSFRPLRSYSYPYKYTPILETSDRPMFPSSLWGPTLTSSDCVAASCHLPEMQVGEWIAFEEVGAYTLATSSTFNGFQKPQVKCVLASKLRSLLKKGSTWSDLCDMLKEQATQI